MRRTGIAIDTWKLEIFTCYLLGAGYQFTEAGGLTPGTMFLTVETGDVEELGRVVEAANAEAARVKPA